MPEQWRRKSDSPVSRKVWTTRRPRHGDGDSQSLFENGARLCRRPAAARRERSTATNVHGVAAAGRRTTQPRSGVFRQALMEDSIFFGLLGLLRPGTGRAPSAWTEFSRNDSVQFRAELACMVPAENQPRNAAWTDWTACSPFSMPMMTLILISLVEIMSMLIPACASVSNIFAATPV